MMTVAIKARHREELEQICKEHKIKIWQSTIIWWESTWKSTEYYLCIMVENGEQKYGGHACRKTELGSSVIILTTRRRLI